MRHVTAETVNQDNETYKKFLEPNGWVLKEGDYLINKFVNGRMAGTTDAKGKMPLLKDTSTIYIIPSELPDIGRLDIASRFGWHVKSVKVRILGDSPLKGRADTNSPYGPIKLFGPQNFDVALECAQMKKDVLQFSAQGIPGRNHIIQFGTEKNGTFKFSGFKIGGGCFSGLRLCEGGSDTDTAFIDTVSGILENFEIHDTVSENIYAGSIKRYHTKFRNTIVRNGRFINAGSEAFQGLNFGEGSVIENLTIINTATEFPSPFQNYQVGTFQIKAGGGSFKVGKIYIENGGQPVFNLFGAAPVYDSTGKLIQDGCRPGDVVEISDIYCHSSKGQFLYVNGSCANGAEWRFSNIHCGNVSKRIYNDTGHERPYAFLFDVPPVVTDKIIIDSITTDKSLPLIAKGGYQIDKHTIAEIPKAKFVKPMAGEVVAKYNVYNEVSQKPFYLVAGQPVKYKAGDLIFRTPEHGTTSWERVLQDGDTTNLQTELIKWDADYTQSPDSPLLNLAGVQQNEQSKDEIIMALSTQLQELAAQVAELETKNTELAAAVDAELQKRQAAIQHIKDILTQLEQ